MKATMKRLLAQLLAMSMCLSLLSASVWASEVSGPGEASSVTEQAEPEGSATAAEEESEAREEDGSQEDQSAPGEEKSPAKEDQSAPGEEKSDAKEDQSAPGEESSAAKEDESAPGQDESDSKAEESSTKDDENTTKEEESTTKEDESQPIAEESAQTEEASAAEEETATTGSESAQAEEADTSAPEAEAEAVDPAEAEADASDVSEDAELLPQSDSAWTGSGTSSDPYVISDEAGLRELAERVNDGEHFEDTFFQLGEDIDLKGAWTPIGLYGYRESDVVGASQTWFSGTFDGKGKTITGLTNKGYTPALTDADGKYCFGLFGAVSGAVIRNVNLVNVAIDVEKGDSVGALVGFSGGDLTVTGCSASGSVKALDAVGGLVGRAYQKIKGSLTEISISDNINHAEVTQTEDRGKTAGILGYVTQYNHCTVDGNTNYGNVVTTVADANLSYLGGIVMFGGAKEDSYSQGYNLTITDNKNYGTIKGNTARSGAKGFAQIGCCASYSAYGTVTVKGNEGNGTFVSATADGWPFDEVPVVSLYQGLTSYHSTKQLWYLWYEANNAYDQAQINGAPDPHYRALPSDYEGSSAAYHARYLAEVSAGTHVHDGIVFKPWTKATSLPAAKDLGDTEAECCFYLTTDVTLKSAWTIQKENAKVHLCLNGHSITPADDASATVRAIVLSSSKNITLTLHDCGNDEHKYTIDENGLATVDDSLTGDYETFTGGCITGFHTTSTSGGCAVCVGAGDTFRMMGGTILGNSVTVANAIDPARCAVYGTKASSSLVFSGSASVFGNTYTYTSNNNTYVTNVGLVKNAKLTVDGALSGTIGVRMKNPGVFTMGVDNTVSKDSIGCFTSDDSTYVVQTDGNELKLGTQPAGTHYHDGITFTEWTDSTKLPTAPGSYCLTTDVDLTENWDLNSGTVNLCLNGHRITSTDPHYMRALSSGVLNLYDCDKTVHKYKIDSSTRLAVVDDALTENYSSFRGGYITLKDGLSAENSGTVNLHGGTIIGSRWLFLTGSSSTMNLCGAAVIGCGEDTVGGASIKGGTFTLSSGSIRDCYANSYGGGVSITGGKFIMSGGSIRNCSAALDGGGVSVTVGEFIMSGGSITGCSASRDGGGVSLRSSGKFTMSGGSITGCSAGSDGGGVSISQTNFTMSGGSITGCSAARNGGGVYVDDGETIHLSGKSDIFDNTMGTGTEKVPGDVHLYGNTVISIAASFSPSTSVGVSCSRNTGPMITGARVFTSGWATNMSNSDPKAFFHSEVPGYGVRKNSDGEAELYKLAASKPSPIVVTHLTWNDALEYGYDEGSAVTVDATANPDTAYDLSYQWYDRGTEATGEGTKLDNATDANLVIPAGKDAGIYYYYCDVTATRQDNGNSVTRSSKDAVVVVNRADITPAAVMSDYTYGTTVPTPEVSSNPGNADVTWYYSTEDSNSGGKKWENMTPTTLDAGDYYLYAVIKKSTNYNGATTQAVPFSVKAKEVALKWKDTSFVYDGKSHTPAAEASGLAEGDSCTVTVTGEGTNAGEYTATASKLSNDNYKLPAETKQKFTVEKKEIALKWSKTSFVYDGKAHQLTATATGLVEGDSCTVTVTGEGTNAGEYTATASKLSNDNYKLPAETKQKFTIEKAEQEAPAAPTVSSTYIKSFVVKTTSGEEYSLDAQTWQTDGTFKGLKANTKYQVYARKAETENYKASPASTATAVKTESDAALRLNKGLKVSQTGDQLNIEWGKVPGAKKYDVWVQYCGVPFGSKPTVTVKASDGTKAVVKALKKKKLNLKRVLRVKVVAWKGKEQLAQSITCHVAGRLNKEFTNAGSIKLITKSLTLKKGKKAKIKAKTVLVDAKKKKLSTDHTRQFRYASSDKSVASVNSSGKVTAKGKGKCTVYVYACNGFAKSVKVTVK